MLTPWGVAVAVHLLDEDVFWVQTTEHDGLLIQHTKAEMLLSARAMALGKWWNTFLTFEQDDTMLVVFYEHPELYPWAEEDLIKPLAEECLHSFYPDYFNESTPFEVEVEQRILRPSAVEQDREVVPT